jgi:hypothetical protein
MDLAYTAMSSSDLDGFVAKYPELKQQGLGGFLGDFYNAVRNNVFRKSKIFSADLSGQTRIFSFDGNPDGPVAPEKGVAENAWKKMLDYATHYDGGQNSDFNIDNWAHFRDILGLPKKALVLINASFSRGYPALQRLPALLAHWWKRDLIMSGAISGSNTLPTGATALFNTAVDGEATMRFSGELYGVDSVGTLAKALERSRKGVYLYNYHGDPNKADHEAAPVGLAGQYYTTLLEGGNVSGQTAALRPISFSTQRNEADAKALKALLGSASPAKSFVPEQERLTKIVTAKLNDAGKGGR